MSVIQSIRDKYARWAVVAIALALLGFILTDYFSTNLKGGTGPTTVGTINGKKIEYADFDKKLKSVNDMQEAAAQQQGTELSETDRHQNIENIWNQEVEQTILGTELEKLGIAIGKKELNDWFFGSNPPQDLKQRFTNEQGQYNSASAQEAINQMKRSPNQVDRDQLESYITVLEYSRQVEKFNSLLTNTIFYPKWYVEKQNTETSGLAKISYVVYPYTKIADSTIKISDKEIEEYINKNKDQYKQEESRSISYVVFSASPTSADTLATKTQVGSLRPEFETVTEPAAFLARFGSATQFFDGYIGKSQIQVPAKDSIFSLAKNAVYGPYLDDKSFVMAKFLDGKQMPDTVVCRHVLIGTNVSQGGIQDTIAAKMIDSVKNAINTGRASWAEMVQKYNSDNDASKKQNGEMTFSSTEIQNPNFAKEFAQFILFDGKKGDRKVVKTNFGYHYIEILEQKNFQPHYKIAYFAKNIVASDETDRTALNAASKFASESRSLKAFDENFDKTLKPQGYQKLIAANIKPIDNSIEGISVFGLSRQLVREIYKAKKGDVLQQQRVGDKYIVAAVADVFKEGVMPPSLARISVEPVLRNKKKAEQIKKTIGSISTLEAAAVTLQDSVKVVDSLRISGGSLGFEPRLLGAVFNASNNGKLISEPIAGVNGVYVVKVDELSATSVAAANIEDQKNQLRDRAKQMIMFYNQPSNVLKKISKIKDNRSNFY